MPVMGFAVCKASSLPAVPSLWPTRTVAWNQVLWRGHAISCFFLPLNRSMSGLGVLDRKGTPFCLGDPERPSLPGRGEGRRCKCEHWQKVGSVQECPGGALEPSHPVRFFPALLIILG